MAKCAWPYSHRLDGYWGAVKQQFDTIIFFAVCCLWCEAEKSKQKEQKEHPTVHFLNPYPIWLLCLCYPVTVGCSSCGLCCLLCCGATEDTADEGKEYLEYLNKDKKNGPKEVPSMTV